MKNIIFKKSESLECLTLTQFYNNPSFDWCYELISLCEHQLTIKGENSENIKRLLI